MKKLSDLKEKSKGKIISLERPAISDSQITELLELGFYPGAIVECQSYQPSLEKMVLMIGGTIVGLRVEDCKHIIIEAN